MGMAFWEWVLLVVFGSMTNFLLFVAGLVDITNATELLLGMTQLGAFFVMSAVNVRGISAHRDADRLLNIANNLTRPGGMVV
jgi:hypothetical protein